MLNKHFTWISLCIFSLLLFRCSSTEEKINEAEVTPEILEEITETFQLVKQINFLNSGYVFQTNQTQNAAQARIKFFDCQTFKGLSDLGSSSDDCPRVIVECKSNEPNNIYITNDFGGGCENADLGISGIIKLKTNLIEIFSPAGATANYELIDIQFDNRTINGTGSQKIMIDITEGANNPSSIPVNYDTDATYVIQVDGKTINMTLKDLTELRDGVYTSNQTNNGTISNGFSFHSETIEPLILKVDCARETGSEEEQSQQLVPVQGKERIIFTKNETSYSIIVNYGEGSCDYNYTITDSQGNTNTYDIRDSLPLNQNS